MREDLKKQLFEVVGPGDIINLNDPKVLYLLTEISEQLVLTDPVISMAIYRASRYPIVDFNIIIQDEEVLKDIDKTNAIQNKIEELINKKYQLKNLLINFLIDYYTYGIAILNIEYFGNRILKCEKCKKEYPTDLLKNKILINYLKEDNEKELIYFQIPCPNCKHERLFYLDTYSDDYVYLSKIKTQLLKDIHFRLWSIKDLEILYEPFTKETLLKLNYKVNHDKIRYIIDNFDIETLNSVNYNLIKYVFFGKGKTLILDKENTFILRYNLPSGINLPFFPLIARGYRNALLLLEIYRLLVNYSQEIMPYRILFSPPNSQIGINPVYNLTKKAEIFKKVVEEIDRNPLRTYLSDTPFEKLEIGGNIQSISILMQFIEMLYGNLIGITELPREIIMEGTWASNIISIRLLENTLLHITIQLNDFLERIANILQKIYNLPKFTLSLIPPRRMDSLSEFQLLFQILGDKFPKELLLKTYYGMSLQDIYKQIEKEKELEEKEEIFSQFKQKVLSMKYMDFIENIFAENTSENQEIDYEKIADEILEETKGNKKKIVKYLEIIAQKYGEETAEKILEIIEQKMANEKNDNNNTSNPSPNDTMPEKQPSRRDDIKSDIKDKKK